MDNLPTLTKTDKERYSRHLLLPEVGLEGQRRLKGASVLCVGAGGLGSPVLLYLAAAGVGRIGLVDFDRVEASNLQRQIIHGTSAIGHLKLESAKRRILDLNPACQVELFPVALRAENALRIVGDYDIVIDGTDNFPTRYLINDACVLMGKPFVYGSIFRFEGQVSVFNLNGGPTYRDLFPTPPPPGLVPSCSEGGVLGVLPGVVGGIQATEALKVILGTGETLSGRLLIYDALAMRFREMTLERDATAPPVKALVDYDEFCHPAGGVPTSPSRAPRLSAPTVKRRFDEGWRPFILDVRSTAEAQIAQIPGTDLVRSHRAIVSGDLSGIPMQETVLIYCKAGTRSTKAATALIDAGHSDVIELEGGISAWATLVDHAMPRY